MVLKLRSLFSLATVAVLLGAVLFPPGAEAKFPPPSNMVGSLGSLGARMGSSCGTEVVSPDHLGDWHTAEPWAKPAFINDTSAPLGSGALQMAVAGDAVRMFKKVDLKTSTLIHGDVQTPFTFQFRGSRVAPEVYFHYRGANIRGYPGETDGSGVISAYPDKANDEQWTDASIVLSNKFYSKRDIYEENGRDIWLPEFTEAPLGEILAHLNGNGKDSTIMDFGFIRSGGRVVIDAVQLGCVTTDFEVQAPVSEPESPPMSSLGSLALGGGLALAAALAVGGGAWAIQNGMIQLPPELAALLPA